MTNITKAVISLGLGQYSKIDQTKIKQHLTKILSTLDLEPYKFVDTKCIKVVPAWNKKNQEMGFKTDFRRKNKDKLVSMLLEKNMLTEKTSFNKRTISVAVKDHRMLKLESFNFSAPEYGFVVHLIVDPVIRRPYHKKNHLRSRRKINLCIDKEMLRNILNKYKGVSQR